MVLLDPMHTSLALKELSLTSVVFDLGSGICVYKGIGSEREQFCIIFTLGLCQVQPRLITSLFLMYCCYRVTTAVKFDSKVQHILPSQNMSLRLCLFCLCSGNSFE